MRMRHCTSSLAIALVLVSAAEARADEASIGTTPARSRAQMEAPPPSSPVPVASLPSARTDDDPAGRGSGGSGSYDADVMRSSPASGAGDPPADWAVLHAGLRPRLGTFGGVATFALAHARTERFYGGFSLSAVRNDAGTHIGLAQISLGRNLSDSFGAACS